MNSVKWNFFGGEVKREGMHLVAWNDICKLKKNGRFGISRIWEVNKALLSKWLWGLVMKRTVCGNRLLLADTVRSMSR